MIQSTMILTKIYTSNEVRDVIKKLKPVHLQEDILQHCFLELFQKEPAFIIDLHDRGKLKSYIVKILYNTATYTRSTFAKQQGKETPTDFCGNSKYEVIRFDSEEKERIENQQQIACAVSEVHWFKADILKMYAELGTYRAVSEKTGIPNTTIFNTVNQARKEIKSKI